MDLPKGPAHYQCVPTNPDEVVEPRAAHRALGLRRWLPIGIALAMLVPVGVAIFVWHSNTKQLTVTQTVGPAAPGELVSVAVTTSNGCLTSYDRLYRRVAGRWLQTHWRNSTEDKNWVRAEGYDLWAWPRTREEFSDLRCPIGGSGVDTFRVPEDADSSPLLACTFGDEACVRIEVRL